LTESYFRNNADLGTGLLMANLAITSPHFFCPVSPTPASPDILLPNSSIDPRILATALSRISICTAFSQKSYANAGEIGIVRIDVLIGE